MATSRETLTNGTSALAKVLSQDRFASALADLSEAETSTEANHVSMLDRAKKDGKGYLKSQGVTLPENATVQITQNSPISIRVCVEVICVTITVTVQ
jgi:hypothetical protein